jgi:hypothetical protein
MRHLDCAFCGIQEDAIINEYAPMLRIDLWKKIAGARWREFMCLDCMRRRLGRPFTKWDHQLPWWFYQKLPTQRETVRRWLSERERIDALYQAWDRPGRQRSPRGEISENGRGLRMTARPLIRRFFNQPAVFGGPCCS